MKLKIKTWDAMVEEFGVDNMGDIACYDGFVVDMDEMLPDDRIIEIFFEDGRWLWDESERWIISNDMIEETIEE